jgi:uncharacterized membrane protein
MAIQRRYRAPNGETRPWTLREIVQGKPVDRPTHPMLIHFPIAFYVGALGMDLLSHFGTRPSAPLAGTWLILAAFAGFGAAATTGLVDRSTMKPGSKIKKIATRHMLVQYAAVAIFAVNFGVRWSHRHDARSSVLWILLDVIGVLTMTVGADLGGQMVFKMGYRVGSDQPD